MNEGSRASAVEECGVSDGQRGRADVRTSPVDRCSRRISGRGTATRLFAWLALAAALIAGRPAEAGTVTGTVKNSATNGALSGVLVKVNERPGKQATTNSSGAYTIYSVTAGSVTLALSKTGFVSATSAPVTVPASGTVTVPAITLLKLGTITGTVVNASSGAGVASATVTLTGTSTQTTTSSSGSFSISSAAGSVTLTISKSGWETKVTGPYTVVDGGTVNAGSIPLVRYGVVRGKLLDQDGGTPLIGATATLSLGGGTGTTDSTGTFSITCVPATYTATFSMTGYTTVVSSSFTVQPGVTLTLSDTSLQLLGTATGLVMDEASGAPLPGALVAVLGGTASTTTGADGRFAIPVPPVSTSLVLSKAGFGTVRTDAFTVGSGETSDVGSFGLGAGGVLSGIVVDAGSGAPLPGALVSIQPPLVAMVTDASGAFSFDLAPGDYSLALSRDGWVAGAAGPFTVDMGVTTNAGSLSLVEKGTIIGTVVKASDGTPVVGATVRVVGTAGTVTTDAAGHFEIKSSPGTATLAVSAPPLAPALVGPATVVSAQTVDIGTVALVTAGTITGTVVAADYGYALSSAVVTVPGTASEAVTNYAGAFTLYVAPGTVSVTASKAGWSTETVGPYSVPANGTVATGAIPLTRYGVVRGEVFAADDESPIEGVTVTLSGGGGTATTDSTGTFSISCPPAAYVATFSRAGFETLDSAEFTTWSGVTLTIWDTYLQRLGTATGLVTSAASGLPLAGVRVAVFGGTDWTTTDVDGQFAIPVPPASTRLVLSKAGFGTMRTETFTVGPGETSDVGTFSLGAGGVLSGIAVDEGTAAPLAGVLVSLQPQLDSRVTDATGVFSFELAPGDYSLDLSKEGFVGRTSGPHLVSEGQTTDVGSLSLVQGGTVTGTVVKASDGTPVAGAVVRLIGAAGTVTTDAAGQFAIVSAPGTVALAVSAPPLAPALAGPVTVTSAQTVDAGTISLEVAGTITGTVVAAEYGYPVSSAVVSVAGTASEAVTNYAGAFTLYVAPGSVSVTATKAGWSTATVGPFAVAAGESVATGAIALGRYGTVSGLVIADEDESPIAGATVTLSNGGGAGTTDGTGSFSISCPPATYSAVIAKEGFATLRTGEFTIHAGVTLTIDPSRLRRPGTATGRLVDAITSVPIEGAVVTSDDETASATTDASGAFSISLAEGSSLLRARRSEPNPYLESYLTVEVAANQVTDNGTFPLTPSGFVAGVVVADGTGTPLEGVTVMFLGSPSATGSTDVSGGFRLEAAVGMAPMTYAKPGHGTIRTAPVAVAHGQTTEVGTISMAAAATVEATVLTAEGASPLSSAVVTINGPQLAASTDASGRAVVNDVPAGTFTATISHVGYAAVTTVPFTVLAGQTVNLGSITLAKTERVYGTTRNLIGGVAVPEVLVTVTGTSTSTISGADGYFALEYFPGTWTLTLSKPGWLNVTTAPFTITVGQSTAVGDVGIPQSGITGRVVDTAGVGIPGIPVDAETGDGKNTDATGAFTVYGNASNYKLNVHVAGQGGSYPPTPTTCWGATAIDPITLVAGELTNIGDIVLNPGGIIKGKVVSDPGGTPVYGEDIAVTGTSVAIQPWDALYGTFWIVADAGTKSLTISKEDWVTKTTNPITVTPCQVTDVGSIGLVPNPTLKKLELPYHPIGGESRTGTVYLTTPAPFGQTVVTLESSNPEVIAVPATLSVQPSYNYADFTIVPAILSTAASATISASFKGVTKSVSVTVNPPAVMALTLQPSTVEAGKPFSGTVRLRDPAPAEGASVSLSSAYPAFVTVPSTLTIAPGAIEGTFEGTTQLLFGGASDFVVSAYYDGATRKATLTLEPSPLPQVDGLSPAQVISGDSNLLIYGTNLRPDDTIQLRGPVYGLADPTTPLCNLAQNACPVSNVVPVVDASGRTASFTAPENAQPGYYSVRVKVAPVPAYSNDVWMTLNASERTLPAQTPEDHRAASRILPGQVVTGTFVEGGDPGGNLGDYNFFYFVAPAGSVVTARLERVDTSQPWEAPSSLDPQLELIAPDGFIYANLRKLDDAAGSDLNATLTGAVLPRGGLWLLAAETRRGAGDYRLTFDLAPAPPATGEHAIPISGNGNTLPLGVPLTSTAIVLDPRGYPLSGAGVTFVPSTAPENKGIVEFAGGNTVTSGPDGSAIVTATFTAAGKASLTPTFSLPLFANLVADAPAMKAKAEIPLYEPVGRWPVAVRDFSEDTIELRSAARESSRPSVRGLRGDAGGEGRSPSTGATDATPLPRSVGDGRRVATLDRISGCQGGTFSNAGVAVPEVHAPFSLTLEDLTPKPGEVTPPGPVGTANGIEGHRVDKTIRLRLTVRDGTGNVPSHPVLVQMTVGGPKAGKLILDPDGARIECTSVSFLWHDQDAQGNVTDPNEIVEYQLGEYSRIDGFTADGQTPGAVKPVWGTTEELRIVLSAPDASGTETWEGMLDQTFPVRPEPGKPDHFACFDQNGDPCPDSFPFWTGHLAYPAGLRADGSPKLATNPHRILNAYYLADEFENETFGYTATSAPSPGPNLTVGFTDQTRVYPDFEQYTVAVSWNNEPAFPQGTYPVTLSVDYPEDPEWSSGTVSRSITLEMQGGSTHVLSRYQDYDLIRPDGTNGIEDGRFPLRTWPGASGDWIQKSTGGDPARLVLLTEVGEVVSGVLPAPEPIPTKSRFWRTVGDHWEVYREITEQALETISPASFRLSLIKDGSLEPVADGAFLVQLCPRFDHWDAGAPCTTSPVASSGGVAEVTVNSSNGRGYLGVSLTAAPAERGSYYIRVQSLDSTYRIRRQSDYVTGSSPTAGEFEGAFSIVNVETLEAADNRCGPRECSNCTGSPCFVRTGVYTAAETDLTVPTAGLPLSVGRTYLSSPRPDGVLRGGWTSSTEARLTWSEEAGRVRARVLMPDGEEATYALDPVTKTWTPPAGRHDTLVKNANGTFDLLLERGAGAFLHFGADGLLSSVCDENGNVQTREHDAAGLLTRVSDDSGRFIDLTWTAGKLTSVTDSGGRTVTYEYDGQDRLHRVVDPAGRVRRYEYVSGRYSHSLLSKVTDGWGRTLNAITWDTEDRTSSYTEGGETYAYSYLDTTHSVKTDSQGHQKFFTFDAGSGLITDTSGPGGEATSTTYDANGHPLLATDPAGIASQYAYDGKGRVLSATRDSQGSSAVRYDYGYDPDFPDRVVSVTPKDPATNARNPNWQGWTYEYHPNGSTRPGSLKTVYRVASDGTTADAVSRYEYDSAGRVMRQTTAGGAETDYGYDASGNLETVTGPAGTGGRPVTEYGHDALGRVTRVTDPQGKETGYTYDSLGRVLTVTLPPVNGRTFTTTYTYDQHDEATGLVYTEITDPNGRLTRLGYDAEGRLRRSVDAAGGATNYDYTGRFLSSITDPNGNVTNYDYNPAGRLATTSFPDGGQENYTYWSDGLLKTKTDRRGTTVTYTYDAFKRIVSKAYSTGGSITYSYEGQKLIEVTDTTVTPAETHGFGYDERYRLASATQAARGSITYTHTADDRVETLGITSGPSATYAYNPDGSLDSLQWSVVPGAFTWDYTPRGQYDTLTFPSGQTRAYAYDDQGRLTSLTNSLGAATLASFAYGYDLDLTGQPTLLGQRTSQTATLPAQNLSGALTRYGYDPLYQLTRAEYPAGAPFNSEVHTWTYDGIGNRATQGIGANVQTYTYLKAAGNPLNGQRLESDGVDAYGYDPAGSLATRQGPGGTSIFGYDSENRLASITGPTGATYAYDYQGRRTSKTVDGETTSYLYDGLNLLSETTNGQTTHFLNGPGIDEPLAMSRNGTISYFSVDGLGSVVATNDPSGAVTHSVVFDAWGNVKSETGTREHPFTYTGREAGEAGFHFYRARFYQPSIGRFSQEDPLGFLSGPNRFGYVRGNPTRAGDPLGLFDWVRDVLEPVSNFSAGFGDTISLGLTYRIRDLTGANSVVDPCDFWYSAGDKAGIAHSLALGGASAARGALAMGGRSGTVLARLARGGGRFFSDPRTYGTVGKQYWKARGGAGVMSLHHWLLPQRAGALNAGWNLLEVPGAFNSWMGYSSVGRGVEWGLRFAIPGSLLGAAIEGAFWGISKDEWQKNCGCGQ